MAVASSVRCFFCILIFWGEFGGVAMDSVEHGDCKEYINFIMRYQFEKLMIEYFTLDSLVHLPTKESSSCFILMKRHFLYSDHQKVCEENEGRMAWLHNYETAKSVLIHHFHHGVGKEPIFTGLIKRTPLRRKQQGNTGFFWVDNVTVPTNPIELPFLVNAPNFLTDEDLRGEDNKRIQDQFAWYSNPKTFPFDNPEFYPVLNIRRMTQKKLTLILVSYGEYKYAYGLCEFLYKAKPVKAKSTEPNISGHCGREMQNVLGLIFLSLLNLQMFSYVIAVRKKPQIQHDQTHMQTGQIQKD